MPFTILFAILFAKIKGYKISYIFKSWTIYPMVLGEIIFIFMTVSLFLRIELSNPFLIWFYTYFKFMYLTLYLFAFFKYKLYNSGLIGSFFIAFGSILNRIVMNANGGNMPVYPSLSYITGYVQKNEALSFNHHCPGVVNIKLKFLSDYLDFGYSIISIGDLFIHFFAFIMLYSTIKAINELNKKSS